MNVWMMYARDREWSRAPWRSTWSVLFRPRHRHIVAGSIVALAGGLGCHSNSPGGAAAATPVPTIETTTFHEGLGITPRDAVRLPSGVYYKDVSVGDGTLASKERDIEVRYLLYLPDGKLVSGAIDAPPIRLKLTRDDVIRGFYEGIPGMRVGGLRRLIVPSEMGYRNKAQGAIPANSILVFEVQLVSVR